MKHIAVIIHCAYSISDIVNDKCEKKLEIMDVIAARISTLYVI